MWAVEVQYPGGPFETVPVQSVAEAVDLMRAVSAAGASARLIADPNYKIAGSVRIPTPAAEAAPGPARDAMDMLDPAVVLAAAKIKLRSGGEIVEVTSPTSSPRFGATVAAESVTEPSREGPSTVELKEHLWAAMHRVNLVGVPWADDFAALVAALCALMRVHHVTVTRPLESLADLPPSELLRQARSLLTFVVSYAERASPWPIAMRQCGDYAHVLFTK